MPQRNRPLRLQFYVTPEEQQTIRENIKKANTSTSSDYLRKMALEGYIIHYDPKALYEILRLQQITANNLNQLTKRAHETRNIYKDDIDELGRRFDNINELLGELLTKINEL